MKSKYIYVNCGGSLDRFNSKKEAMDFFEECIMMCEGSERERYTNIYFSIKKHINDSKRCFTDGTNHIFTSEININEVNLEDEALLKKNFNIDKKSLLILEASNCLASNSSRIYDRTLERYKDVDELYDEYLSKSNEDKFYYFKGDSIICIDTITLGTDKYFLEEFPIKDYKYADKWLKCEIEYSDYLKAKSEAVCL